MYVETLLRIANALDVSLDILADTGETDNEQKILREAFYMISHDKSTDEIRYAVEMVRAMFKLKEHYWDKV